MIDHLLKLGCASGREPALVTRMREVRATLAADVAAAGKPGGDGASAARIKTLEAENAKQAYRIEHLLKTLDALEAGGASAPSTGAVPAAPAAAPAASASGAMSGPIPTGHTAFSWAHGAVAGKPPPFGHTAFSWSAGLKAPAQAAPASTAAAAAAAAPRDTGVLVNEPFSARVAVQKILAAGKRAIGQRVVVCGWVKTNRAQKGLSFVELNDGSCLANLQVIIDASTAGRDEHANAPGAATGASMRVVGTIVESPGKQETELKAEEVTLLGTVDSATYPLAKKGHSLEFLREVAHLRPRTNTIGAVMRVRNQLAYATHTFFQSNQFLYVHTPLVTASDCEGAGEMFQVTTHKLNAPGAPAPYDPAADFFSKAAYLTVSGQLNGEYYACALSSIYTFGPTFRAEESHTTRHLAEFWMIEPEIAFADLTDDMNLAEAYLKACFAHVLAHCADDLRFLSGLYDKNEGPKLLERLQQIVDAPFVRISYTEAVAILQAVEGRAWEFPPVWGAELQTEHERYLCEVTFKSPTIVYNYPKGCKAFYMRLNDDNKTVAAMDVLFPKVRARRRARGAAAAEARAAAATAATAPLTRTRTSSARPRAGGRDGGRLAARGAARRAARAHGGAEPGPGAVQGVPRHAALRHAEARGLRRRLRAARALRDGDGQHPRCDPLPEMARQRGLLAARTAAAARAARPAASHRSHTRNWRHAAA
jgi:asparaginyl-tRNA synthetase